MEMSFIINYTLSLMNLYVIYKCYVSFISVLSRTKLMLSAWHYFVIFCENVYPNMGDSEDEQGVV